MADKPKKPTTVPDEISLTKLVAKMPQEWRKKLRKGLDKVGIKDPGLGMILKAEIEKLGKEIEAKKEKKAPGKVIDIRKKSSK